MSGDRVRDLVGLVARLALGGVLVVAGALKVTDPALSARAVQAYQLLPFDAATYIGWGPPVQEETAKDGVTGSPTVRLNGTNLDLSTLTPESLTQAVADATR